MPSPASVSVAAVLAAAVLAATVSSPAWAGPPAADSQDLEARLRAQDERIRQLEEQVRRLSAEAAKTSPPAPTAAPEPEQVAAAPAAPSAGQDITIKLRGRLQADAAFGSGDDFSQGTQIRRFYLGAEGKLGSRFSYLAEADFAGNKVSLQDVMITYALTPRTDLVAGHFKPSATNDDLTSDVYTLFLERSAYSTIFAPGRRVGVGVNHAGANWGVRAGLFGERDDSSLDVSNRAEGWVASARVHADLLPGDDVLHVAVASYYTQPSGSDHAVRITEKPEVNRAPSVLDTGVFPADHGVFGGLELGYATGPLTVQAEGGMLRYRGPIFDPLFRGVSAQVSWRWTGEARPYDVATGTFGRVTPARPFDGGGPGAFETGLRVTYVDLDDDGVFGGQLTTYGIVFNWYPITRVRLGGNYIHAQTDHNLGPDLKHDLVVVRGAVDW